MKLRLLVAYDGTGFHGFAVNAGVETVGGLLTEALGRVLGHEVRLTCAGRTDAGVHANGQVVSLDTDADPDLDALRDSLNKMCAPQVVVRMAEWAPDAFDARHSATGRIYRYSVLNTPVPDPFRRLTAWHIARRLDVDAMQAASQALVGEHDFSSFCRRQQPDASLVRLVRSAQWVEAEPGLLRFEIAASSFCQQMVRSIVGTLVEVGTGKRQPEELAEVITAGDRQAAGQLAPPHGLCLWEVQYGTQPPPARR